MTEAEAVELARNGTPVVERLARARRQLAVCQLDLAATEGALAETEVGIRHDRIEQAGGDFKLFGPNEAAQKSEMAYRVIRDTGYQAALTVALRVRRVAALAQVELDCLLDERRALEHETQRRLADALQPPTWLPTPEIPERRTMEDVYRDLGLRS